jgi:hypothetical protein
LLPKYTPGAQRPPGQPWRTATIFTEELAFFSDIDTAWIMGRGIAEWLGWPL